MNTRKLVILAFLSAILTVQEEVLSFLPNIQLTFFLLVLYAKKLNFSDTLFVITLHVLFDNLFVGSFNLVYTPIMWIGYSFIPILSNTIFKIINTPFKLAITGVLYSLLYCWTFVLGSVFIMNVPFMSYFIADLPFELILSICTFLSILWLYEPCAKLFDRLL
ncbi:hypothetical protein [Floccifex sp.]|uniref:hypothetical protein n=1 Tax=Floccifex sp. TaxID=2815810 RepID=UPI003F0D44DC